MKKLIKILFYSKEKRALEELGKAILKLKQDKEIEQEAYAQFQALTSINRHEINKQ